MLDMLLVPLSWVCRCNPGTKISAGDGICLDGTDAYKEFTDTDWSFGGQEVNLNCEQFNFDGGDCLEKPM